MSEDFERTTDAFGRSIMPKKERPMSDAEIGPDGHEWAKTEAGYAFVQSMIPHAYDKQNLLWHGWALRAAFVAGAEWQEKRQGQVNPEGPAA